MRHLFLLHLLDFYPVYLPILVQLCIWHYQVAIHRWAFPFLNRQGKVQLDLLHQSLLFICGGEERILDLTLEGSHPGVLVILAPVGHGSIALRKVCRTKKSKCASGGLICTVDSVIQPNGQCIAAQLVILS